MLISEKERLTGSNTPTAGAQLGTNTTRPELERTAPENFETRGISALIVEAEELTLIGTPTAKMLLTLTAENVPATES